jgi:hypothetical protein
MFPSAFTSSNACFGLCATHIIIFALAEQPWSSSLESYQDCGEQEASKELESREFRTFVFAEIWTRTESSCDDCIDTELSRWQTCFLHESTSRLNFSCSRQCQRCLTAGSFTGTPTTNSTLGNIVPGINRWTVRR